MVGHEGIEENLTPRDMKLIVDNAKLYSVKLCCNEKDFRKDKKPILKVSFLLPGVYYTALLPEAKSPFDCIKLTLAIPTGFYPDTLNARVYAETARYIFKAKQQKLDIITGMCKEVKADNLCRMVDALFDKHFVEIAARGFDV